MERLSKQDRITGIAIKLMGLEDIKITRAMIKIVLEADRDFILESLLNGSEIHCDGLGTFKFNHAKARGERASHLPKCNGSIIEATPEYSRVKFQMGIPVIKAIKEKTLGNPFVK